MTMILSKPPDLGGFLLSALIQRTNQREFSVKTVRFSFGMNNAINVLKFKS